jgi:hypothetical protein
VLPRDFQYFGLWLVVCFVLQGWFAWRLIGLFSDSAATRLTGVGFFLFAPSMVQHLLPHPSLSSHFLILAALYYYFLQERRGRTRLPWALLLATGTLTHTYLLAIITPIWLASMIKAAIDRRESLRSLGVELSACVLGVAFLAWQAGYFVSTSDPTTIGYGLLRGNLLSLVDSNQWSRVLPDIGSTHVGDVVTFVGLGVLLLALVGLPGLFRRDLRILPALKRHWTLSLALLGLSLFAITHNVGFGPYTVKLFAMQEDLQRAFSTFRASGRMLWPISYLFVLGSICLAARSLPARWVAPTLAVALAVQVVDTDAGWKGARFRHKATPAVWVEALDSPFWDMTAKHYKRVRHVLPVRDAPNWETYAYYAARHGLPTDAVSLARSDNEKWEAAVAAAQDSLTQWNFDEETLYFLDEQSYWIAQVSHDPERDLVARLDGVSVYAPKLRTCGECRTLIESLPLSQEPFRVKVGEVVQFGDSAGDASLMLRSGWIGSQPWGIWSLGQHSQMLVPFEGGRPKAIRFRTKARVAPSHPHQRVMVTINDVAAGEALLTEFEENEFTVAIPRLALERAGEQGLLRIEVHLPDAVSSSELGAGESDHALAMGLMTMTLE